jgi:hypothetical protein
MYGVFVGKISAVSHEEFVSKTIRQARYGIQGVEAEYSWGKIKYWAAAGFKDTEWGVCMKPEVSHGATNVYAWVQAGGGSWFKNAGW